MSFLAGAQPSWHFGWSVHQRLVEKAFLLFAMASGLSVKGQGPVEPRSCLAWLDSTHSSSSVVGFFLGSPELSFYVKRSGTSF